MNKTFTIACLAVLFAFAAAQKAGDYCMTNADCRPGNSTTANANNTLCCGGFASNSSASPYTQFNCIGTTNGTATLKTHTCLVGNATYESVCATEDKTCVNAATKYVSCGNSIAMAVIDFFNSQATCTSASGAMSLASSALFAVIAALALLF
jgi:hypothetical protein